MRLAVLCLVLLTGCTRTVYVDRLIEVKVPVRQPCLSVDDIPAPPEYALAALQPPVSDGDIILAMRHEIAQRTDYGAVLMDMLRGCARP